MAQPTWAPTRKAGESHEAYKARYYSAQRVNAEETGDQGTTDKIYGKLKKSSHSVDAKAVDKGALEGVSFLAGGPGIGTAAKLAGKAIGGGAVKAGEAVAGRLIPEAAGMARQGMKLVGRQAARKALPAAERAAQKALPKPAQKALPKPEGPSPKMQHVKVRAGRPRAKQATSRNKGTNPRAIKKKAASASG